MTIRYADGLRVDVHVDAQAVQRWQLPPVVLPELRENAVKHNEFSTDNLFVTLPLLAADGANTAQ